MSFLSHIYIYINEWKREKIIKIEKQNKQKEK